MNLSNYRYNTLGGVDADRVLDSGEVVEYTLSEDEVSELTEAVSGSQSEAIIELTEKTVIANAVIQREVTIAQSTVTVTSGNIYHADKQSVVMLGNARQRLQGLPLNTPINWSLYGTPSGFMTSVTHEEIIEAHNLAVDQLSINWEIT